MSFDIAFSGAATTDEDGPYQSFSIQLGEHRKEDIADLTCWSTQQYQEQWFAELRQIAEHRDRGALITSLHDPEIPYRIWCWPMWRQADLVHFQNRLLFMLEPETNFKASAISEHIGEYKTYTEDGQEISTWSVPLSSIRDFLLRKVHRTPPCSTPS